MSEAHYQQNMQLAEQYMVRAQQYGEGNPGYAENMAEAQKYQELANQSLSWPEG